MIIHKSIQEDEGRLEIIGKDKRFGLVIDKESSESSWFIVDINGFSDSGFLNTTEDLIKFSANLNLFLNNA